SLVGLNSSLESSLLGYTSFSDRVHVLITDTAAELTALDSSTAVSFVGGRAKEQALAEELPALAKEVARVKIVRDYAGFDTERVWCFCLYKPEFNFALVYKITRDYVDTMDELLQPLVDKARLVAGEDRNLEKFSSLYVFCDRPDWLDLWAEIEFSDTLEKLKAEADDERKWKAKDKRAGEIFRKEWVEKISTVVLRGFEASCQEYLKNKRQWQEKREDGWMVSRYLVGALDYLQTKMAVTEENLNRIDFVSVWRSLASGIDHALFNGIFMSSVKFYDSGVESLSNDLEVLFGAFRAWCLRPQGFSPKLSEGLKLLKMRRKQHNLGLTGDDNWMKENGVRHMTVSEAKKMLKNSEGSLSHYDEWSLPLLSAVPFIGRTTNMGVHHVSVSIFGPELLFQFQQLVGYSFALHNWKRVASRKVGKVKLIEQRAKCYHSPVTLVAQ
ncbi:unnamed protein product, partial [Linum tenue]